MSELAIRLTAASPEADLLPLIAQGLKSITDAVAVAVSTYDAEAEELVLQRVAVSRPLLTIAQRILGANFVGLRVSVSPELRREMLADVMRVETDLSATTMGAVPKPIGTAIQKTLGIGRYVGLALHHGGELLGTAVVALPRNAPVPSVDVLRLFAHLVAASMQRRRAEEALRESERRYRSLFDGVPIGLYRTRPDGQIVDANAALQEMLGYPDRESLLSANVTDTYADPEDRARWRSFIEGKGVVRDFELRVRRYDGDVIWVQENARSVEDSRDRVLYYEGSMRDVTARKRMAEAMRQYLREMEVLNQAGQALNASLNLDEVLATTLEWACSLLNATACSVWLFDSEGGELVCRRARGPHRKTVSGWRLTPGEGLAGWVAETGESLIVADTRTEARHFKGVEHETGLALRSILSVPLRVKETVIGVLQVLDESAGRFRHTDRMLLESLMSPAAIALENARLYESLQQRMAELEQAQVQLVQAGRMAAIGELAAGVAHELNNPLMAVLGFSELLLERTPADDPDYRRLEAIHRGAGRARDIVSNLLSFSRQTGFRPTQTNLNLIVEEALALIRLRLKSRHVAIEEHYAPDLPPLWLDAGRMKQVVLNLLTNALDAMPGGGRLMVRTEEVEGETALHVSDTGEGIPGEHLARVFEPFFTTKPVGDGSGLGLSVSLGIVQEHGGRIEVESEEGEGSTFTVWLPAEPDL